MIKNVIFDWSGTLSNDIIPVYTATMKVFETLGLKALSLEEYKKEFMLPYMDFYKKFRKDLKKEKVNELFFNEINSVKEPKLFSEAKELLEYLKKRDIKMAILSSHPEEKLKKEIKEQAVKKFFKGIYGGVHNKVKTIKEIIKNENFKAKETAYVGDMTYDIEAGKKAKVIAIAVSWGYQNESKLLSKKPDIFVKSFSDLKSKIVTDNKY